MQWQTLTYVTSQQHVAAIPVQPATLLVYVTPYHELPDFIGASVITWTRQKHPYAA